MSFLWLFHTHTSLYGWKYQFFPSPAEGRHGCFQVLVIVSKADAVRISLWMGATRERDGWIV